MNRVAAALTMAACSFVPSLLEAQVSCGELEALISAYAQEADCRRSSDCAAVQLPPPLGCNVPVNKAAADVIDDAVREYRRSCGPLLYNCLSKARSLRCESRRCEIAYIEPNTGPSNSTLSQHGRPLKR